VACDPYTGAIEAVLECARNLACVGARPLGVTNCLNFGNPEKPHIAWQLTEAVRGMGDACRALGTPVVGGNVSLYNEGPAGPIYPTPIVGMVGIVADPAAVPAAGFAREGDEVALVGPFRPSLAGSELEKLRGGLSEGLPEVDLDAQVCANEVVRDWAPRLVSAHDISDGGLAVALAECCIAGGIGARIELPDADEAMLFGEGPGGFVVSGSADAIAELARAVPVVTIGAVGGDRLLVTTGTASLEVKVADADAAFASGIPDHFQ